MTLRRGALMLLAAFATSSCYDVTPPNRAPLALTLPDTGTADGASVILVAMSADTAGLDSNTRKVTLTTTAGNFTISGAPTATLTLDPSGRTIALLRAPLDSTMAIVSATLRSQTTSRSVAFHRAMPDRVDVVPDQFTVVAGIGHELPVTVTLRRTVGAPSSGLEVSFSGEIQIGDSTVRGALLPATATTDGSGVVHARFTVLDTTARGPATIRATVAPSGISGTAMVQVVKP